MMGGFRDTPAGRAEDALCDLQMVAAIQYLCESSLFRTAAGRRFEARINKLCREHQQLQHQQLQVRAYDKAHGEDR